MRPDLLEAIRRGLRWTVVEDLHDQPVIDRLQPEGPTLLADLLLAEPQIVAAFDPLRDSAVVRLQYFDLSTYGVPASMRYVSALSNRE